MQEAKFAWVSPSGSLFNFDLSDIQSFASYPTIVDGVFRQEFSIAAPNVYGFTPPSFGIASFYDPISNGQVAQPFFYGGSYGDSRISIITGSFGIGYIEPKFYFFNSPPNIPFFDFSVGQGKVGRILGPIDSALAAFEGLTKSPRAYIVPLGREYLGNELFISTFRPGYLESMGFDPENLAVGLEPIFDPDGNLVGLKRDDLSRQQEILRAECFSPSTQVLDISKRPKAISDVCSGDTVLAFDAAGNLHSARVTQVFVNEVDHLLDIHGLEVTPGHLTLCGDGPNAGGFAKIYDILQRDGAVVGADGGLLRLSTWLPVGGLGDVLLQLDCVDADAPARRQKGTIRAGAMVPGPDGQAWRLNETLAASGLTITQDGLVHGPGEAPHPLLWYGEPPRPEDYVLWKSGLTREEIAEAREPTPVPRPLIQQLPR